ncbi:MAG: protein-L-isoaspartate(D-aspartate) O-methyltransferase [Phycisphaerales bacterium]|nr:protein-L-isoaspartate(D-aspartate) O-methyltransferase [Hyphomonadaceae bacterium]
MSDAARLMRFVLELRQAGVTDARALSALERTPRTHYAPEHLDGLAYDDISLPLAHAQTMTKPSVVGRVLSALAPQPGDCVLEIGAGSGYQTACIANLAHKVVTLERWRDLTVNARSKFGMARLMRVHAHTADGFEGWAAEAPYDRIVVNGALADIPQALLDQLKPGGTLLAALGDADSQRLIRYRNERREDLGPIKFAPLERGVPDEPAALPA